jgi:stage II sporulation protein D
MRWRALGVAVLIAGTMISGQAASAKDHHRPVVVSPLRLIADARSTLTVGGLHAYAGDLLLSSASDGLVVVNRLPLEKYLLGLNEVPLDWPIEALRAQAIAARTYALHTLSQPRGGAAATYGFDICASVECQVFSGADVLRLSSDGQRWVEAVTSTAGTAVLYRGDPILARYHSTSGGRTFDNEQIFPSEGAYPYLKGVTSISEGRSPLYRWRVVFRLTSAQRILERAGSWAGGRLRSVRTIASASDAHYPDLLFEARRKSLRMSTEEFRDIARELAPAMFPKLYPSPADTSAGRLPETLPSNRFRAESRGRRMIVRGRGWGHGVGMSQWGAEGMARQGASSGQILDHYYSGVEIDEFPDPGPIDVGVAWARSEVTVSGAFRIVDGENKVIVEAAAGTWRFRPAGPGAVAIDPPRRHDFPVRVAVVSAPDLVTPGDKLAVEIALASPASVTVGVLGDKASEAEVLGAGRRRLEWRAPRKPGTHNVVVTATRGSERETDRFRISVAEAADPGPEVPPAEMPRPGNGPILVLLGVLGAAAILGALKVTMRR